MHNTQLINFRIKIRTIFTKDKYILTGLSQSINKNEREIMRISIYD